MNTQRLRAWGIVLLLGTALVAGGGCKGKKKDESINPDFTTESGESRDQGGFREGLPEIDEATLFGPDGRLRSVYFDYDSYTLRPDALSTLRANADVLVQLPNVLIQIEGHCDERGTQEYNLALGEKRALAVRQHLMNLGISGDRIVTISYGEEDPVDPGHSESAWSKNRRAEFNKAQ